jgi:anthranilate phosphoribosyltransferase
VHRFVKAVGAGQKRARDLTREEAREAMTLICQGRAAPVQVGAFLLALRMKGESADELAGFVDALGPFLRGAASPPGTLDVDCHGDGHAGRATLLPAAAGAAAALGVPVLLRTDVNSAYAKHGLRAAMAALGFDVELPLAAERARRDLETRRVALLDLAASCAPLYQLVTLRPYFGVRTVAQTLMKLIDPLRASARLVGVFHAPYLPSTARALAVVAPTPGLCVQAIGGLPEASPGKQLRVASTANPEPTLIDLRAIAPAPAPETAATDDDDDAQPDASDLAVRENHAALAGEEPFATRAATAAAVLLHAARGLAIPDAYAQAKQALLDGRARAIFR